MAKAKIALRAAVFAVIIAGSYAPAGAQVQRNVPAPVEPTVVIIEPPAPRDTAVSDQKLCFAYEPVSWDDRLDERIGACERITKATDRPASVRYDALLRLSTMHDPNSFNQSLVSTLYLDEAISLNPRDSRAFILRARSRDDGKQMDDYDEAIRIEPVAANFHARCLEYELRGELDKALNDCTKAVSSGKPDDRILLLTGELNLRQGQYPAAVTDYDALIALVPADQLWEIEDEHRWWEVSARALYGRGVAKLRLGQEQSGRLDIAAARKTMEEASHRVRDYMLDDFERMTAWFKEMGISP